MSDAHVPPVNAFTETAALWHLMEDRPDEVWRIIGEMSTPERQAFSRHLGRLQRMTVWRESDAPSEARKA